MPIVQEAHGRPARRGAMLAGSSVARVLLLSCSPECTAVVVHAGAVEAGSDDHVIFTSPVSSFMGRKLGLFLC